MTELERLYARMAELTKPECASACRVPHSCCDAMYCGLAEELAAERGVVLERTDHPTLPFMGPNGCTVPPHLRPLCTFHVCAINSYGFKPGDAEFTKAYFALRDQIEGAEGGMR